MAYYPKSKSDKWMTPPELYEKLNNEFHFDYDPCPIDWKEGDIDSLKNDWGMCSFVNPPYSKVKEFVKKAYEEYLKGKTVVLLINACTDTKWFHDYIYGKADVRFVKGRVKFINPNEPLKRTPNVRPSMIVIYKH